MDIRQERLNKIRLVWIMHVLCACRGMKGLGFNLFRNTVSNSSIIGSGGDEASRSNRRSGLIHISHPSTSESCAAADETRSFIRTCFRSSTLGAMAAEALAGVELLTWCPCCLTRCILAVIICDIKYFQLVPFCGYEPFH